MSQREAFQRMREHDGFYHWERMGGKLPTSTEMSKDDEEFCTIYGGSEWSKQESKRQTEKESALAVDCLQRPLLTFSQ